MQTLYRNEGSLTLRWLMLVVGVMLLAVTAADYFAFWPLFGVNQHMDLTLLLVGSAMALIGLKETMGLVKGIDVDGNGIFTIKLMLRGLNLEAGSLRTLTIYAAGKDKRRLTLATDGGSFTFPMTVFAADRFAESIKAINPAVEVERRQ